MPQIAQSSSKQEQRSDVLDRLEEAPARRFQFPTKTGNSQSDGHDHRHLQIRDDDDCEKGKATFG